MTREKRNWPSLMSLVAFFLIVSPFVYVLSYAPFVRAYSGPDPGRAWDMFDPVLDDHPTYRPVDWLIDNTPLQTPLFAWASLWGVQDSFEYRHDMLN